MNNQTAEQGMIGCLLLDPVVCWYAAENAGVNENWLTDELCRKAWKLIGSMDKQLVNSLMVLEESRKRKDEIPLDFLDGCIDRAPEPNNIGRWIYELRGCFIRRNIKRESMRMAIDADDADKNPEALLAEVQTSLYNTAAVEDKQPNPTEVYNEIISNWKAAKERGGIGLPTSWKSLTSIVGGYRPGKVYILASRPGGGKSTFMGNEAFNLASMDVPVSIASLEMSEGELRGRMLATAAELSSYSLDTGYYDNVEIESMTTIGEEHAKLPIRINDNIVNIDQLCSWAQFEAIKYKAQIIIVDYLQLIASNKRFESRNVEVGNFMSRLCSIAKIMNIPVLVLSQLSRNSEHEGRAPELRDLRDSGSIEQGAYGVVFINHTTDDSDEDSDEDNAVEVSELIVAKNRGGPNGQFKIKFERNRQRFVE